MARDKANAPQVKSPKLVIVNSLKVPEGYRTHAEFAQALAEAMADGLRRATKEDASKELLRCTMILALAKPSN